MDNLHIMEKINKCAKQTATELQSQFDFSETQFETVLYHYIQKQIPSALVSRQVNITYETSCGFPFGFGRLDILVETDTDYIILELKQSRYIGKIINSATVQLKKYLYFAKKPNKTVRGMLVIFGPQTPYILYAKLTRDADAQKVILCGKKPFI